MWTRLATVLVLVQLLAPVVAGFVRPLVAEPPSAAGHCSSEPGCDPAIACRRSGSVSVAGTELIRTSFTTAFRKGLTDSESPLAISRPTRCSPRALTSARFHRKRPAPTRNAPNDPSFAL